MRKNAILRTAAGCGLLLCCGLLCCGMLCSLTACAAPAAGGGTAAAAATTTAITTAATTTTATKAVTTTTTATTAAAATTTAATTAAAQTGISTTKVYPWMSLLPPTAPQEPSSEEKLHETLREAVGERFVPAIFYGDYDGDGTTELFAAAAPKGEAEDWEFCVDLYYVGGDTVTCLEEAFHTQYDKGLENWDFGDRKFFAATYVGADWAPVFIWSVSDGECFESVLSEGIEEPRIDPETRELEAIVPGELSPAGWGSSYLEYCFCLEDGAADFTEYGAIEITREQLLLCGGAAEALAEIEAQEGNVIQNYLYRGNGMIHINCLDTAENMYMSMTLVLEGRQVVPRPETGFDGYDDGALRGGHYLPAAFPEIAVYPEAFPVE